MFINIGNLLLFMGLIFSLIFIIINILFIFKKFKANNLKKYQRLTSLIPFFLTLIASLYLLNLFIQDNFQSVYVYNFSSSELPLYYKISAFWAGNAGSLLFWQLINTAIAFFVLGISIKINKLNYKLQLFIGLIFQLKILFFYLLLLIPANPFYFFDVIPPEGSGLNPMLQSPGMIFHPPLTFLGYAAAFVPFVIIIAGLISRINIFKIKEVFSIIRNWTLSAWFFLTIGIIIGAQWAYYELGWGGYWSWDPVENASLLPWLFLTGALHGIISFRRYNIFKLFSTLMIIGSYFLTIFATYITRSELLDSVHAFGSQAMGVPFLLFIFAGIIISLILIFSRRKYFGSDNKLENISSRNGFLLLTNITLVIFASAVFLGTMFPIISRVFIEGYIIIGQGYYNQIAAMLGGILIAMLGACYFLSWDRPTKISEIMIKNKIYFIFVGITIFFYTSAWIIWLESSFILLFRLLTILVIISLVYHLIKEIIVYWNDEKFSGVSLKKFILSKKKRISIIMIHLGIIILILGLTGYGQQREYLQRIEVGEKIQVEEYQLELVEIEERSQGRNTKIISNFNLFYRDDLKDNISSSHLFYSGYDDPHTSVGVYSNWKEDFYLIFGDWLGENNINIQVRITPLVKLIWFGSYIIYAGFLLLILPKNL